MNRIFLTMSLLAIGIIAPILACSDDSCISATQVTAKVACYAMPKEEISKVDASLQQMPWSENKNLSDRDINDIMNKR